MCTKSSCSNDMFKLQYLERKKYIPQMEIFLFNALQNLTQVSLNPKIMNIKLRLLKYTN